MEYSVIFSDLDKIKKILEELLKLNSNVDIKTLFNKLENNSFRKVIEIQYIYMFCKSVNILHSNKSIKIITLEENLKLILNKEVKVIVGLLNKLGYIDSLLLLLNLKKSIVDNIEQYINSTKNIKLKENTLDLSTLHFTNKETSIPSNTSIDISEELIDKIVSKLGSNVNIEFNQSVKEEPKPSVIKKIENVKLPEIETSDDSDDSDDIEDFTIPREMKKIGNNILNEYTKEEIDETDNVKESKVKLNKNDTDLLDLLG